MVTVRQGDRVNEGVCRAGLGEVETSDTRESREIALAIRSTQLMILVLRGRPKSHSRHSSLSTAIVIGRSHHTLSEMSCLGGLRLQGTSKGRDKIKIVVQSRHRMSVFVKKCGDNPAASQISGYNEADGVNPIGGKRHSCWTGCAVPLVSLFFYLWKWARRKRLG